MSQSGSQGTEITLSDVDEGELSDSRGCGKTPTAPERSSTDEDQSVSGSEGSCLLKSNASTDSDVPQWLQNSNNNPESSQDEESITTTKPDENTGTYSDLQVELITLRQQHDSLQNEYNATIETALAAEREVQLLRSDLDKTEESVFRLASEKATLTVNQDKYLNHISCLEVESKKQSSVIEELLKQHNKDIAEASTNNSLIATLREKTSKLKTEALQMSSSMEEAYAIAEKLRKKVNSKKKRDGIG